MECKCEGAWKIADQSIDISLMEPEFKKYMEEGTRQDKKSGNLITILQKAQELYKYLPVDLLAYIAHRTGVKPAKVMGVVTFYTQFRTKPVGKHLILLCQGTACHVNGSGRIEEAIKGHLGVEEGEVTPSGMFTYNNVACLGCCSLSPVMMIDGKTYGGLTGKKAIEILKEIEQKEAVQ